MKRINWDRLLAALVLVRIGQDLGTDSRIARTIHDLVDLLVVIWR